MSMYYELRVYGPTGVPEVFPFSASDDSDARTAGVRHWQYWGGPVVSRVEVTQVDLQDYNFAIPDVMPPHRSHVYDSWEDRL
jgi:hypothetical protein